jgi:sterol desaturase/sphingolipid hydroxylase (fatty acid hydroxylase superfamily)
MISLDQITQLLTSKGGIVVAILAAVLVLERVFPVATWKGGFNRVLRNFGLAGANALLSPLIVIPLTQFADLHTIAWRPEALIGGWMILLDLLLLDLWIYWWHRINHVLPFLWRFHEVHHLDETLDASSALRFHFGEVVLSALVRAVVIIALDMPLASVIVFEVVVAASAIFHHSNLKLPSSLEQVLSKLIVTPSLHWVHHHALRRDTDSNYATILSIWDIIFGSRSHTHRTPELPIGVEGLRDDTLPHLALRPFLHHLKSPPQ